MSPMQRHRYPANWSEMVTNAVRAANYRCQGCGCSSGEDGTNATTLTTHHPDRDPENADARLTGLCARCHLAVEANARLMERLRAQADAEGVTMADAWRAARNGVTTDQMELA